MAQYLQGAQVIHLSIALAVIDCVAVSLRFLARWKSKASFAVDDWWIVGSMVPFFGMVASSRLLVIKGGLGRPIATLTSSEVSTFLRILMATMITYSLTITCVKISLLLLYRRIFTTRLFKMQSFVVGIACITWLVVEITLNIFQCTPFTAAFQPAYLFTEHCINLQAFYWGVTGTNLGLDIVLLLLPMRMVSKLQLPRRQKMVLLGIFLLGGLVCIAGIMRMVAIGVLKDEDLTLSMTMEYAWSQIEPAIAILCACIVTYRPLFHDFHLHLSKLSDILSHSRSDSTIGGDWTDMNSHGILSWPVSKDFPENAKC